MLRRFLLAAAAVVFAVGVFYFGAGLSRDVGGASVAAAMLLAALAMAVGEYRTGDGLTNE